VSPDGRWFVAASPISGQENTVATTAFAVDGSTSVPVCLGYCSLSWDAAGKFVYVDFHPMRQGTYPLPVLRETGLPQLPLAGITQAEDFANAKAAALIPQTVNSAVSPFCYAYTRQNIRRNLYRIPLP
jgi:hypothetical protein